MIRLTFITVRGNSDKGTFEAHLDLGAVVQVISAHHSYGKLPAAKAIAWCLGVKVMFGVSPNDASYSPDAVLDESDLPTAGGAKVESSECSDWSPALRRSFADLDSASDRRDRTN